jgi:hypothetical protein
MRTFLIFVLLVLVPTFGFGQVIKTVPEVQTGNKNLILARGAFMFLFEYGPQKSGVDMNVDVTRSVCSEGDHVAFIERAGYAYEVGNRKSIKALWEDMYYLSSHEWKFGPKGFTKKDYYQSFSYATRTRAWSWVQEGFDKFHDQLLAYRLVKVVRDLGGKTTPSSVLKEREVTLQHFVEATVASGAVVFMDAAGRNLVKDIFQRFHPKAEIWEVALKSLEREHLVEKTYSGGYFYDDAEKPLAKVAEKTILLLRFIAEAKK